MDNKLTTFPDSMKNLSKLKTLKVSGNPLADGEMAKLQSWFPKLKIK